MKPTLTTILCLGSLVPLSAEESDLVRLYEEEVLAQTLYLELGKAHPDIMPFRNIPRSEARHREVMAGILADEGIELPKAPKGRRFVSEGLDQVFRKWLREGRESELAACRVGVRLEELDIADLRKAQKEIPEHRDAFAALESASNNHLRAFHRNLMARDGTYTPEALDKRDFRKIVNTGQQPGGGRCEANCKGGCKGNCDPDRRGGNRQGRQGKGPGNGRQGRGGPQR